MESAGKTKAAEIDIAPIPAILYHLAGMSLPPAAPRNPAYGLAPFNFVDLEDKAAKYIAHVNAEANRIATSAITEARNEVERIRKIAAAEREQSLAEVEQLQSQAREEAETLRKQLNELRERLQAEEENFKTRKEQLESEAIKLKAQLKQNEDAARKTGYDEGKQVGYDEGHSKGYADGEMKAMIDYTDKVQREAEIQLGTQLETLMPALKAVLDRLDLAKQTFLQQWEQSAVEIAIAIASKAIARQLPEMIDVPVKLLREALELGTGSTSVRIRLNQADYQALQPQMDMLIQEMMRSVDTEVVWDDSVSPGGCIVETPQGLIDNQIESRLERIGQELCLVENC